MITISDFALLVNQSFTIEFSDQDLILKLDEVKSSGKPYKEDAREPFSLLFSADASSGVLKQGNYELGNGTIGKQSIFLVPIGVEENTCHYEAIYN